MACLGKAVTTTPHRLRRRVVPLLLLPRLHPQQTAVDAPRISKGATYDLMRKHDSHLSLTRRQRVTNGRRVVPPEFALTSSRLVSLLPFRFWGRSGQKGGKSGRVEMRGLCRPSAPLCKSRAPRLPSANAKKSELGVLALSSLLCSC